MSAAVSPELRRARPLIRPWPSRIPRVEALGSLLLPVAVGALIAGLAATVVVVNRGDGRDRLADEFALRTTIAANDLGGFVQGQEQESAPLARALLTGRKVGPSRLGLVVAGLGYTAGGLFDARGRMMVSFPYVRALVGKSFLRRLEHIRVAVRTNRPAVSKVVESPVLKTPAIGIAVPFPTRHGRRIFSGVFAIRGSALSRLARSGLRDSRFALLDRNGDLVAATGRLGPAIVRLRQEDPALASALGTRTSGTYDGADGQRFFAGAPVPATPWRLVASIQTSVLYAPLESGDLVTDDLLFGLAGPILLGALVFGVAARRRELERARHEADLERQVAARTTELRAANAELESFSYSVAHDLKAPLRSVEGFSRALLEDYGERIDETGSDYLRRVGAATARMRAMVDGLLDLARLGVTDPRRERVDLGVLARPIVAGLGQREPGRSVEFHQTGDLMADGDPTLLRIVLANLLENAWKFTAGRPTARIELARVQTVDGAAYVVRDNGTGFDMEHADKLFHPFQRLHSSAYPGTGVGLATVKRIVDRHGGRIWAEASQAEGAAFYFTLGAARLPENP